MNIFEQWCSERGFAQQEMKEFIWAKIIPENEKETMIDSLILKYFFKIFFTRDDKKEYMKK